MAESQIRRALRSVIGAPSRPVRRALSAPLNAGALSEWAAFEAGFFPSLAPLHQRLVRAPLEDARHRHDHSWRLPDKLFPGGFVAVQAPGNEGLIQAVDQNAASGNIQHRAGSPAARGVSNSIPS